MGEGEVTGCWGTLQRMVVDASEMDGGKLGGISRGESVLVGCTSSVTTSEGRTALGGRVGDATGVVVPVGGALRKVSRAASAIVVIALSDTATVPRTEVGGSDGDPTGVVVPVGGGLGDAERANSASVGRRGRQAITGGAMRDDGSLALLDSVDGQVPEMRSDWITSCSSVRTPL